MSTTIPVTEPHTILRPAPVGRTHTVRNQPPERTGVNEYLEFPVLREAVEEFGAGWATAALIAAGAHVGTAEFQEDARLANAETPELVNFDHRGNRIDEVRYHPSYHRIIGAATRAGAHTSAWAAPRSGAHVARAASFSLFAQIEPGHACPISMTHAAVPALQHAPDLAETWLPRLFGTEYDGTLRTPGEKPGVLMGMAMTEKQGGSDVRVNETVATRVEGGALLTGHKWFCSAPMSDAFLVLAREGNDPEGRISCFFVPRILEDGTRNEFRVQRLKNKLGNKSNASSEIELDGTVAMPVGEPGRGVRTIIEMVARTRLDCVLGTAAGMRQAVAEALWHVRHRAAFGRMLVDQPAMTGVVTDLALESEASTLLAMRLAAAHEDGADAQEQSFRRLATAVAKYRICKRGPAHAYEAMECLGGNGYTEDFPLAMRYREQPVSAIWEGSGNVIALDVLRALTREPESIAAFDAELALAAGVDARFDALRAQVQRGLADIAGAPVDVAQAGARRLVGTMGLALQAGLMLRYAPSARAEAFIGARLGEDRGIDYGVLPAGTDHASILARH
ncbi:acyl-CoA dehydrogenase family protein [Leucobacter sp. G161]|uniref:acyl-CoA dehydrogenase family protein n=1 Tax=Leucobacter sp. G161 TaxID=663704 RepID=UPI00073BBBB9|nr:acyl-CoA dehydrogenase family protein [Leucobacter sp. G161]KUF07894.1 DNA alkylation response protein [Leucobacter sp. G161]